MILSPARGGAPRSTQAIGRAVEARGGPILLALLLSVSDLVSNACFFNGTILNRELHSFNALADGMFILSRGQKGKIPIREWPSIAARHEQGESLASIARAYGCTAPAISYILRRLANSERRRGGPGRAPASEPAPRLRMVEDSAGRLDPQLRERVHSDISAFLVAFDAACDSLTGETSGRLLQATDRLLRAAARTRIELERLGI